MAPPAAVPKAEPKKRARKPSSKVRRVPLARACLPLLTTHAQKNSSAQKLFLEHLSCAEKLSRRLCKPSPCTDALAGNAGFVFCACTREGRGRLQAC